MQALEKMLEDVFKKVPSLPQEARKGLATALPWLALAGGVLSLIAAWYLYQAVSWVSQWDYASSVVGYPAPVTGIGMVAWVGIAILVVQAVLSFVAFPSLRANKKSGWNLLLWMALITILYGVVANLFSGYLNLGGFILSLFSSAIGLYLLFQVRSFFTDGAVAATPIKPTTTTTATATPPPAKTAKKE